MMSILLALILAIASIPNIIIAEDGINEDITENASVDAGTDESSETLVEDISKRDKFSKHYVSSGGSRYLVVFPEQVHYSDAGEWKEIDNTLSYDSVSKKYTTNNESFTAGFSEASALGELVTVSDGEYTLSWSVKFPTVSAGAGVGSITADSQVSDMYGSLSVTPSNAQILDVGASSENAVKTRENIESLGKAISGVRYNSVHGGNVDLRYTVLHGKVEEDIILNSADGFSSYVLVVNTDGLTATAGENGKVSFSDSEGAEIFSIAAPWMKDASGEVSNDIEVAVIQRGETAYINYEPSSEWLTDASRSYPVLIDPSFTTRYYTSNYVDTYVYDVADTELTRVTETSMKVGSADGKTYYPYIKILNVPFDKMQVEEATFTVYTADPIKDQLALHYISSDWTSQSQLSTITSNTQPTTSLITSAENEYFENADDPDFDEGEISNGKFAFDITTWLNYEVDHYAGTYTNTFFSGSSWNGFKLTYTDSDTSDGYTSTDVYSSEHNFAGYRPTLTFKYTYGYYSSFEDGAIYNFKNEASGKYLTVEGGNTANGTNIYQYEQNNTRSQAFRLDYVSGNDAFLLRAMCSDDGNGSVVHYDYASSINKTSGYVPTNVQLNSYHISKAASQEWVIEPVEGYGLYKIVSNADPKLALTAMGTANGTASGTAATSAGNVLVSEYIGADSQHWVIETGGVVLNSPLNVKNTTENVLYGELEIGDTWLSYTCPITVFGDTVSWSSTNPNVATVDDEGYVTAVDIGVATITATVTHTDNSTSVYSNEINVLLSEGIYFIQNTETERYVEIEDSSTESGANIQQWDFHTNNRAKWQISQYSGVAGYYRIKSAHSNLYIGVDSADTSKIKQYSTLNNYTLWKIEKTASGNYKFTCKATETSGNVLGIPSTLNANGTDLTQSTYVDNTDYLDEWTLYRIKYTATVRNYYDLGYLVYYGETESESIANIMNYNYAVAERYLQLFGLMLNIDNIQYCESSADKCKGEVSLNNIDSLCNHSSMSHTHQALLYSDFLNNYGVSNDLKNTVSSVLWCAHKIEFRPRADLIEYNRSQSFWNNGIVLMLNRNHVERMDESISIFMHEMNHQYEAPDHYHEIGANGICRNADHCSECSGEGRPFNCIMQNSEISINSETVLCDYCKSDMIDHLEDHHKFISD